MLIYIFSQGLGAVIGSALLWGSVSYMSEDDFANPHTKAGTPPFFLGANALNSNYSMGNGFFLEFMGTFLLCLIVLMTVKHPGNLASAIPGQASMAPYSIGYAVFIAHLCLIPFTGCGINPARTFGPALVSSFAGSAQASAVWANSCWIYYIGPLVGASLAAGFFRLVKSVGPAGETAKVEETRGQGIDEESEPLLDSESGSLHKSRAKVQRLEDETSFACAPSLALINNLHNAFLALTTNKNKF